MVVQRTKLSDQVADQLRSMITGKQYRPGEKLPVEAELAAQFGVSRITVRQNHGDPHYGHSLRAYD